MGDPRAMAGLLAASAMMLVSAAPLAPQARPVLITDVNVVDVVGGGIARTRTVTIIGETIAAVDGPGAAPAGAHVVDGRDRFLIPGLWDMHAHNQMSGEAALQLYLVKGVVGTRDMGSDLEFILPLRDRIRRSALDGPEIVAAGPMLDNAPEGWPFRRRVTNDREAREAVRELKQRGVDFIKVHNNTPRDVFFAIADEAPKQGLPFAGHVPLAVTIDEGAASGMKSIEHFSESRVFRECTGKPQPYDAGRCRPLFDRLAAHKIWQTPTLAFFRVLPDVLSGRPMPHAEYASDAQLAFFSKMKAAINLDGQAIAFLRSMSETNLTVIKDMLPRGNVFLAGCDGGTPGFCLHDELQALTEAGLTPLQALQTATINPARFLGREKSDGAIGAGRRASLALLDGDPLADIRNVRRIAAVVVRGRVLARADIERITAAHRRRTP